MAAEAVSRHAVCAAAYKWTGRQVVSWFWLRTSDGSPSNNRCRPRGCGRQRLSHPSWCCQAALPGDNVGSQFKDDRRAAMKSPTPDELPWEVRIPSVRFDRVRALQASQRFFLAASNSGKLFLTGSGTSLQLSTASARRMPFSLRKSATETCRPLQHPKQRAGAYASMRTLGSLSQKRRPAAFMKSSPSPVTPLSFSTPALSRSA